MATAPRSPLILVSIDGFRADYLQRGRSPNLQALADGGANAAMRPSFPSLTFPNHYTLVTGLTPDHNGIVANSMVDTAKPGVKFMMSNNDAVTDGYWWDGGTPMWVSAEKAGKRVGVEFWPGSEAEIEGTRPSYFNHFDNRVSNEARVDQILAWMDLPADQRPSVYLLYFDIVDHQGHDFGPESAEVNEAIGQVDSAIGRLRDGLKTRGVAANLIIVADHGMAAISPDRAYFLEDYLPKDSYDPVVTGPEAMINPMPGHEADLDALTKKTFDHMHCWHKRDIPAKFKYGKNPRVPEVMCLGDVGWLVANTHEKGIGYKAGAHGYDPAAPEMAALFIANGPDIKPGVKLPGFDNVDVYDLEMKLIGLKPRRNDGSLMPLQPALQ
ncbi:MAG TPA: ectonucleotide pyrophosphatase/phosphodiesterase [Asticcacaulis sp.]|nr:ectonucleotide pyrophosphatase/phosphodiesterase [Asticcacaulis sp.]